MIERRSWRFVDGMLLVGLCALALFAARSAWQDIFYGYGLRDQEQSHILLAPFIAVWLAWIRRERLRFCRPRWTILGPILCAGGWLLAWTGFNGDKQIFWHFGALLMLIGAALTVVGMDFMRNFFPAVLALAFLMPIPGMLRQQIALPLQDVSAHMTQFLMEIAGLPVTSMGNVLSINGQEVAVAEACNGMRMVAALGLVAYAFVFSTPMRNQIRIFILLISPLIAIICNVIRLFPTVLLYGYADQGIADLFHDASGWLMLPIALAMVWGVFRVMRWIEIPITPYAVVEE